MLDKGNLVILPPEFGDGWLSKPASDLVRLVVAFSPPGTANELVRELVQTSKAETINVTSVFSVLNEFRGQ